MPVERALVLSLHVSSSFYPLSTSTECGERKSKIIIDNYISKNFIEISCRKKALQVVTKKSSFKYTNWCKGPAGLAGLSQTVVSQTQVKTSKGNQASSVPSVLFNISSK